MNKVNAKNVGLRLKGEAIPAEVYECHKPKDISGSRGHVDNHKMETLSAPRLQNKRSEKPYYTKKIIFRVKSYS